MRLVALSVLMGVALVGPLRSAELARYDNYRWHCDVANGRATLQVEFTLTIQSEAGKGEGGFSLVESKYVHIRQFEAHLLGPKGKPIQKLKQNDLTKACGFGAEYELFSDICHYYGSLNPPSYPASIDAEYTLEYDNLFVLPDPPVQFVDASIGELDISLTYDEADPIAWKSYGVEVEPIISSTAGRTQIAWHLTDIPPDPKIRRQTVDAIGLPKISLSAEQFSVEGFALPERTWQGLGQWYNQLAASQYLPKDGAPVAITGGLSDARRIFFELTRSTRYVAVTVGISGWQPYSAKSVAARGYGDCKGLSTLLISRLRAAGVTAWPVLVRTRDLGLIDSDFVTTDFNHLITCAVVGSDTLWLDPTCTECQPGDLPSMDENTIALLMDDTGGWLVRLPLSTTSDNRICRTIRMTIDDSTFTHVSGAASMTGNLAHTVRSYLKHARADQLSGFTYDYLMSGERRFKILSHAQSGVDSIDLPVMISGELTSTRKLDRVGQTVYLSPFVAMPREQLGDLQLQKRNAGVNLGWPWSSVDTVLVSGPIVSQCDSVVIPSDDSCQYPEGKTMVHFERSAEGVLAIAWQETTSDHVPVQHFDSYQAYLTATRKLLDRPVKFFLSSSAK